MSNGVATAVAAGETGGAMVGVAAGTAVGVTAGAAVGVTAGVIGAGDLVEAREELRDSLSSVMHSKRGV